MDNNSLTADRSQAIRSLFNSYKHNAMQLLPDGIDETDFEVHCIHAGQLFTMLDNIAQTWGCETINYNALTQVFSLFAKRYPDRAQDTLELFANVFEIIATVLEHKETVYFFNHLYRNIDEWTSKTGIADSLKVAV